jgi:pentatricopeptide repeat protein
MNEAYQVLSEMIDSGFSPSVVTYNAIVNGFCCLGRAEEAVGVLKDMVERNLFPDVVSYSTVISLFCRNGELGKAFQMKAEMVEKGILPDAMTYSSLIQGLCRQRKLSEAFDLFREMLGQGLSPDEVTYTSLMNGYCVEGELSKALNLHDEMMQKGFLPDVVTYSVLINGLNKKARTREAKKLLLKLFYDESVPNDVTYDTLIENCSDNEFKSVVGLVKGFCMKGLMEEADRVFKTMHERNFKPDGAVYNLIIHGHCRRGNVRKAYDMYREMVRCGFVSHVVTVIALIKALSKEGMIDELSSVMQNILSRCTLNDAELPKSLVEINFKEGNMDGVLIVLTEMANDGLLSDGGDYSCALASA